MTKPKAWLYCYDSLRVIEIHCKSLEDYKAVIALLEEKTERKKLFE